MVGVVVSSLVSVAATWLAVRLGPLLGYVDRPDDPALKAHVRPAVPLGGVAIFAGVHLGLAWSGTIDLGLLAATSVVLVLGLVDDRLGLSPQVRLIVTGAAGVIVALGAPTVWSGLLVVLMVVVAVNAVNLFDGLDGLAASSAALAALAAAALAVVRDGNASVPLALVGALAGFLVFNWHPARAFLGDNGAYVVAVVLTWSVVAPTDAAVERIGGFGVLGVFLIDLVVTVWRRRRAGAPLFAGDRSHLYDRLHQAGWSVPAVALMAAVGQAAFGGSVVLLTWWLEPVWAAASVAALGLTAIIGLTLSGWVPAPNSSAQA